MNILDVIIVLAAVAYGFSGFRNGAVTGALSLVGFFAGAAGGAQLAEPLGRWLANGTAQVPVAIVCVLMVALIGQLLGVFVAARIKERWVRARGRKLDAGVGGVLGIASVLLVSWMVAVPLASSPYPALSSAASHSSIVRGVNDVMPKDVRSLYGSLRSFLDRSGFPPVFGDLPDAPNVSVAAPYAKLPKTVAKRVRKDRRSIVMVYGQAPSCNRDIEGSGFVIAPHRVLTNAHVVAGVTQVGIVRSKNDVLPATVVHYDPRRDVAVLNVPSLKAPALQFSSTPASTGDPAIVVGYPEGGPFSVKPARVRTLTKVSGADIYGKGSVQREVYSLRAVVRSGNSGGPLLADNGTVLGVVFATALDSSDTGFALTADEVAADAAAGIVAKKPVPTGSCAPD